MDLKLMKHYRFFLLCGSALELFKEWQRKQESALKKARKYAKSLGFNDRVYLIGGSTKPFTPFGVLGFSNASIPLPEGWTKHRFHSEVVKPASKGKAGIEAQKTLDTFRVDPASDLLELVKASGIKYNVVKFLVGLNTTVEPQVCKINDRWYLIVASASKARGKNQRNCGHYFQEISPRQVALELVEEIFD